MSTLRRVLTDHVDSCHLPNEEERHHPPTRPASPPHCASRDSATAASDATAHAADAEKGMRRRVPDGDALDAAPSAEERYWEDDIVTFDSKTDPQNPKNWSSRRKVSATLLFGLTTMCSTFASSVFSSATPFIARDYGISTEVGILGISIFIAGYIPGPVIWAPISELYGRRISVLLPMFMFICFSAATATATNLQTIFITRFFAGVMASSPVTTVGGGLADMYDQKERGSAVVFYSLAGVVAGPTLGPVIGSAVSQSSLGWRWTEYLTVILTSVVLIADLFYLPETFAPVLLTGKARRLRLQTGRWALHSRQEMQHYSLNKFLQAQLLRPLRMLATEPMVTLIATYNSFAYGILYLLFAAVPIVYEEQRGWNNLVASLPFVGVLIGTMVGAAINITYAQKYFMPHVERHDGEAAPEKRLPPMMIGAILFPVGFFLLGWTAAPRIQWFPSVLGLVFIGASFLLIFQAGINYLIDAYTTYAASAVAANTFLRSIFAAVLPFVAQPMFRRLGVAWACTLLGCVGAVLAAVPFLFYIFGKRLRAMSRMAKGEIK